MLFTTGCGWPAFRAILLPCCLRPILPSSDSHQAGVRQRRCSCRFQPRLYLTLIPCGGSPVLCSLILSPWPGSPFSFDFDFDSLTFPSVSGCSQVRMGQCHPLPFLRVQTPRVIFGLLYFWLPCCLSSQLSLLCFCAACFWLAPSLLLPIGGTPVAEFVLHLLPSPFLCCLRNSLSCPGCYSC